MALTAEQIDQQRKEAEELLFSGPEAPGFAKGLFAGQFNGRLLFPYPELSRQEQAVTDRAVEEVGRYCAESIDAAAIDRNAEIPASVVAGLGRLGVLGMTAPSEVGGRDFSQLAYTRVMQVIGGHCASTAVFVNAHHSIGIRALLMFGTEEQKHTWLPPLCSGEKLAAFALTEPEAGSDAANVQTTATPTPDGSGFVLNGTKRWITNGGIADVLTVMARTPGLAGGANKKKEITAFLVTPDLPGFRVLEARMNKNSIRGTATGRLAFENMFVPKENVFGRVGQGLNIALSVLNFGRTTFGASCTGVAQVCVQAACAQAKSRIQFQQPLSEFELVKKKIAYMAAHAFAMDAVTSVCASLIDRGVGDYKLETAMLKVWSTEALWQIVNDTMQIYGGASFFFDEPYERMMRDARLNLVGEGANDVLRAFIAVVGIKPVADQFLAAKGALSSFDLSTLFSFGGEMLKARFSTPPVPVRSSKLRPAARDLGRRVKEFGLAVQSMLVKHREQILFRQYVQERLSDAACELFAASCTLAKLDRLLTLGNGQPGDQEAGVQEGRYYLRLADRRIKQCLAALTDNDDEQTTRTADAVLGRE
jgi:alkylation response protein AidB-like acyl-CoA dehydrogenase